MGFNQHTRGTWVNNMIYNIHLLVGKISEPGNSPFSLTGQPSACGTAREVGTLPTVCPADMVVVNPKHRGFAEEGLEVAPERFPTASAITPSCSPRMLKDGKLGFTGPRPPTTCRPAPTSTARSIPAGATRRPSSSSRCLSDGLAMSADLILPTAMWVEKEGMFSNAERRGQIWRQQA